MAEFFTRLLEQVRIYDPGRAVRPEDPIEWARIFNGPQRMWEAEEREQKAAKVTATDLRVLDDLRYGRRSINERERQHRYHLIQKGTRQVAGSLERVTFESRDENGMFHNEKGPALILDNRQEYWFWHGLSADKFIVLHPEQISINQIYAVIITHGLGLADYVRAHIERYVGAYPNDELDGYKRVFRDLPTIDGGRLIHTMDIDERFGILRRLTLGSDEAVQMVIVKNRTPEPDGSFKTYYLRVPPTVRTAHEAVAWTFNMTVDEYNPTAES